MRFLLNRNKITTVPTFAIGLLLFCSQSMAADEEDFLLQLSGDEKLISIATGTARPVSKAPAVATVITAEDIRNSGVTTLTEVFERVPGLHVITSHGKTQSPTYAIRGINTEQGPHTLFLVNGHDITFIQTGNLPAGFQFPLASVARIEIIRGPGSAVYGADAFSGVINIITKTDADIEGFKAGAKAGSFDTQGAWGQYGGVLNGWHVAATVEYNVSDGDRDRIIDSDLQTAFDGLFATMASRAPGSMDTRYEYFLSNLTLSNDYWTGHFNSWHGKAGAGAGIANALDPSGFAEDLEQYLFDISYEDEDWHQNWSLKTTFSHLYSDSESHLTIFPAGASLPLGADGNLDFITPVATVSFPDGYIGQPGRTTNTTKMDVTALFHGWQKQRWRLNAGIKREDYESRENKNFGLGGVTGATVTINGALTNVTGTPLVYIPDADRTIIYASAQDEWDFATDWQLIAGVRHDHYSDFGGTTNPRVSLIWNTRHDLTTKLLYGRAFRAPSFAELFAQNNPVATGNPNLEPETIDTIELAFDYKPTGALNINFNLFHYLIDGLIGFDSNGMAQNISDQKASGLELEAQWQVSKPLRLFGSFSLLDAEDANSGVKVADVPRRQLHIGGAWRFNQQWSGQLDTFRIMDRPRAATDTRAEVKDYTWTNLTVNAHKVLSGIDLQLAVRNLTDTDAREPGSTSIPSDYPLEGRSLMLGIAMDL